MGQKLLTWNRLIMICYIFSRRPQWRLSLKAEPINFTNSEPLEDFQDGHQGGILGYQNNFFSNAESPCRSNTSHQVLAQSVVPFGRCHLKIFKMAAKVAILAIGTR